MKIISNNPAVLEKNRDSYSVDGTPLDVLREARNFLEKGHELVTMPLPANQRLFMNPYRSVIVKKGEKPVDMRGIVLLEKAIERFSTQNFNYDTAVNKDFAIIDMEQVITVFQMA